MQFQVINPTVEATAMDNNLLNDKQHVNISATITTMQKEMNNGNEKFSNDKSDIKQTTAAANNDEIIEKMMSAKNNAKIMRKRDTGELKSHSLHEHLRTIKGRHSISDLISGQLPNQIVKATHNLVNSNELLRQHIKPHLDEPQFSIFKEPNALKSNQMSNLVSYLNELVNDQVKMRSCIELPSELQKFYNELMQHTKTDDNERNKKSVDEFSMTRRKFKRNVQHNNKRQHHSKLELEQKCKRVYFFHAECLKIHKCTSMKPSLIEYFKGHKEICEILKKKNFEKKSKRSFKELNDVTAEFAKLYNYKNYFLESNFE
ncbi:hypothetical protein PVAND_014050 [Polypedilum vanderplanki]|uniref:Uncharacterized protein n=1 Tax=Polypedilum vanderplanki TaxID=319348 RepID=A0A9J6CSJ7_POLVA|nr:hypothetical protein PVAND_014050 [Polypedilum vanderplanki]